MWYGNKLPVPVDVVVQVSQSVLASARLYVQLPAVWLVLLHEIQHQVTPVEVSTLASDHHAYVQSTLQLLHLPDLVVCI